jgi:hypothetical protein
MEENLLRNIITSLNKAAFSKFIYDLWCFKDSSVGLESSKTYSLPKIGDNIFEHYQTQYTTKEKIMIDRQIYNLVIPFFYPLDLFNNPNSIIINDTQTLQYLKKYKRIVDKRHSSWFYPTDGMYYIPNIAFITNYSGLHEDVYQNVLIPAFEKLIDEIGLDAQTAIGTVDSFIEREKDITMKVFHQFFEK